MKKIVLLGASGSIGVQTIDVVLSHPDEFEIKALSIGYNVKVLKDILTKVQPEVVCVVRKEDAQALALDYPEISFVYGDEGLIELAGLEGYGVLVNALVGFAGLLPTMRAIETGHDIALANKETLVVGGQFVMEAAKKHGVMLTPIDSEHSAIFQCLQGNQHHEVKRLIVTASGGSFRNRTRDQLKGVTVQEALSHPNWSMGAKITIDSATMMNKGFEVIEAKWLFGVRPDQIEVVVHPQSVIHSMVQYEDGAVKAQLGMPDMRLPIQYAFSYPQRIKSSFDRLDFSTLKELTFEQPDTNRFRCLALAYEALNQGGNMACILNAANEVVVAAFLQERIPFLRMSEVIEETMAKVSFISAPTYEDYVATDAEARRIAESLI